MDKDIVFDLKAFVIKPLQKANLDELHILYLKVHKNAALDHVSQSPEVRKLHEEVDKIMHQLKREARTAKLDH